MADYEHQYFRGISIVVKKGQCMNLPSNLNNHLSSVRKLDGTLSGESVPAGCLLLFEEKKMKGKSIKICGTTSFQFIKSNGWNDITSSVCSSFGSRWQLYQHSGFGGFSFVVESGQCSDVPTYFNDHLSSIKKL